MTGYAENLGGMPPWVPLATLLQAMIISESPLVGRQTFATVLPKREEEPFQQLARVRLLTRFTGSYVWRGWPEITCGHNWLRLLRLVMNERALLFCFNKHRHERGPQPQPCRWVCPSASTENPNFYADAWIWSVRFVGRSFCHLFLCFVIEESINDRLPVRLFSDLAFFSEPSRSMRHWIPWNCFSQWTRWDCSLPNNSSRELSWKNRHHVWIKGKKSYVAANAGS